MIRTLTTASLVALAAFGSPGHAHAQVPAQDPRPERWALDVDLAFSGATGNDQTVLLTSGFKIAHLRTDLYELEWTGSVRYGRSEGKEVARNQRSGLKFDLYPQARWSPFLFSTAERDPFRRIDLRAGGGMGVKYTFWRNEKGTLSLSVAGLYSYEDYMPGDAGAIEPAHHARWSWRLKGDRRIGELIRVENTTFYQPVWDRSSDYLLSTFTSIGVPMSERIALTLTHTFERDSQPVEGVHKNDQLFKAGITIRTRW